ncbi:MAG: MerR family transcriptional regulator [Proteobacteria bacterium]|nr:MerR family transcriptional regulator [Pseudomonadota bacterium]
MREKNTEQIITTVEGKKKYTKGDRSIPGLRMRELAEATGLPKSAILHYVARELLPEPIRKGRNMAYYDPVCIERIRFIKDLQNRYSFPLSKIKTILASRDQGKDVNRLIELNEIIFGSGSSASLDEAAFCTSTGLNREQVKDLMHNGLILPVEKGIFNEQDVAVGTLYARGFALGIKASDLAFYAETAKGVVDKEMRLRQRLTGNLPETQDAELTGHLVQAARMIRNYVFERFFQQRVALASHLKDEVLLS